MSYFRRMVRFEPGHDCLRFECRHGSATCIPGTGGSHGRHGLQIRFVLKGDKGAIQFLLMTDWTPEPTHETRFIMPADIGYHAKEPQYDDQEAMDDDCEYTGGVCYYDGSGLKAEEPFRVLCNEGDEALWQYLEAVYRSRFEGADYPESKPYKHAPRGLTLALN